jgi:hypothetical protein
LPYSWFDQITLYNGENLNYQTLQKTPIATVNYYPTFAADGRKIRNARGLNTPNENIPLCTTCVTLRSIVQL